MTEVTSFADVLRDRAAETPNRPAVRFLPDDGPPVERAYGELYNRASAVAARLLLAARPGDRALLLIEPGLAYVEAFFGCLLAGVIAVPAYPPTSAAQVERLLRIRRDSGATVVLGSALTVMAVPAAIRALDEVEDIGRWIRVDDLDTPPLPSDIPWGAAGDVAFLQYTSGTTGTPKGVMVGHDNLLANNAHIADRFGHTSDSHGVIWLPPYHDMGLIGGILQPIYRGFPVTLLSPLRFLRDPASWLRAVSDYRGTTSGGPTFAYELCRRKIPVEARASLDLRSWSVAFVGAEPVRAATLRGFAEDFAECGFDPAAFFPCYGMAEATLMISGAHLTARSTLAVDPAALAEGRLERSHRPDSRELVSCGPVSVVDHLLVVDTDGNEVPDGCTGELWFAGPAVARGYWGRPNDAAFTATCPALPGRSLLRTGDLGLRWDGEVYPVARIKDVVIVRGRNYAPDDIERAATDADGRLRTGGAAAFTVEREGHAEVWIAAEVTTTSLSAAGRADISDAVRASVAREHGIAIAHVALLRRGQLPKTSSGKIRRHACRDALMSGSITDLSAPPASVAETADAPHLDAVRAAAAHVLRLEPTQVPLDRPLGALGLDSVGAVQLQARLQSLTNLQVDLATLLSGADLTVIADGLRPGASGREPVADTGALTTNESALWFLDRMTASGQAYHLCHAVDIDGPLSADAIDDAVTRLTTRHPALRTTFPTVDGVPTRRAGPSVQLRHLDAGSWDDAMVDRALTDLETTPFDLEHGPLWRIWHLTRGADRHTVAVAVHHIVADLWSLTLLARELIEDLAGAGGERTPALGMAAVAAAETGYLSSPDAEVDLSTWRELLEGWQGRTSLPTDRPRCSSSSDAAAEHAFAFDETTTQQLRQLGASLSVTPYSLLLASLSWTLGKQLGTDDVLLGAPTTGRFGERTHEVVGHLVNTVPVRLRLHRSESFADTGLRAAGILGRTLDASRTPFAHLVQQLGAARDGGRNPLFDVVLAWQQPPSHDPLGSVGIGVGTSTVRNLTVRSRPVGRPASPFELLIEIVDDGPRLVGTVRFHHELWETPTVAGFVGHWQSLLTHVLATPHTKITDAPIADAEEIQALLTATAPRMDPVDAATLDGWIATWARQTPEAVAVQDDETTLTYAELEDRVARGAAWLRALGVGPEVPVGILTARSAEHLVAISSVLRAGGAFLPLDPTHPLPRLVTQIQDSKTTLVLTDGQTGVSSGIAGTLRGAAPRFAQVSLNVDEAGPPRSLGRLDEAPSGSPERAAYVMYTSGTTGAPKGVIVPARGLANLLTDVAKRSPLPPGARYSWWTKPSFDLSVYEIFTAWSGGGTVVVVPQRVHTDPLGLATWLIDQRIDAAYVPLFAVTALVELAEQRAAEDAAIPLRRLMVGVEPLPATLLKRICDAVPGLRALNAYGPTEATIISAVCDDVRAWSDSGNGTAPIGGPVNASPLFVLDPHLTPVPLGVIGDIHVGGVAVTRGYLGRPAETAASFVPDPRGRGARMYRTGDQGRWDRHRRLHFLGRCDRQVKLRGVRLELGEVEGALLQHPAVESVVTRVTPTANGGVLHAYVVPRGGHATAPTFGAELNAWSRHVLPAAMVPSVVVVDRLPMTTSGKIDYAALPAPYLETAGYEAPGPGIEQTIAAVWSDQLGGARIGRSDDFFALGGHSLLAAQAAVKLSERLGCLVDVSQLFAHPTVAALAQAVQTSRSIGPATVAALPRAGDHADLLRAAVDQLPDDVVRRLLAEEVPGR